MARFRRSWSIDADALPGGRVVQVVGIILLCFAGGFLTGAILGAVRTVLALTSGDGLAAAWPGIGAFAGATFGIIFLITGVGALRIWRRRERSPEA